jgi:hypothetical protein
MHPSLADGSSREPESWFWRIPIPVRGVVAVIVAQANFGIVPRAAQFFATEADGFAEDFVEDLRLEGGFVAVAELTRCHCRARPGNPSLSKDGPAGQARG